MSFLKKRKASRQEVIQAVHRLPRQVAPPTLKQLQSIMQEITELTGRNCELAFGVPPEDYSLAVIKDRRTEEVHWALYRGEGPTAMMLWDQTSFDPGAILQLINAQFPGLDLKQMTLRTTTASESALQSQSIFNSSPREEQSTSMRIRGKPTFEGDLKNIQMPNVIQSISLSKGTGRLEIDNLVESATIYFADGLPVHCISRQIEGEAAFIELIGWDEGEFRFFPDTRYEQTTIRRNLETLLLEGAAIADQFQALKDLGAQDSAFLSRKHSALSEKQFESMLAKGTGSDLELAKRLYLRVDGRTRLIDLVRRFDLNKLQWVPLIFDLATCNLVDFNDVLPATTFEAEPEAIIDWSQAQLTERLLTSADTGIYTYPTFLFFLNDELWHWKRFGRSFSIIILKIGFIDAEAKERPQPLPAQALREIAERVEKIKRKTDTFAHYEGHDFALLLLETDHRQAAAFARRLTQGLTNPPLYSLPAHLRVVAKAGLACIPDDCSTAGALLAQASPDN